MLVVSESPLLTNVLWIAEQLKWICDYLLYSSFFHSHTAILLPEYLDNFTTYENIDSESHECAVCLCKIDQGDQIRELTCRHLFHRVCLDRWFGCGHFTCPLCRNELARPPPPLASEIHQEIIMINFSTRAATRYDGRATWWLR